MDDNSQLRDLHEKHLEWAIEQRAEIQRTLLALYRFVLSNEPSTLDQHTRHLLNHLIGAAFSLWRAVFLAHTFRDLDTIHASQEKFLLKVITDNAITFPDDKANSHWTVGYYLENGKLRLSSAITYCDAHLGTKLTKDLTASLPLTGALGYEFTRYEWESIHFVLRSLFKTIAPASTLTITPPSPPAEGPFG